VPNPEAISAVGDGMGSGVNVGVGTKVGKKTVDVGAGSVGIGVRVGAGLVLTQDERSMVHAVKQIARNRNRLLPLSESLSASLRGRMAKRGTSLPWWVMR